METPLTALVIIAIAIARLTLFSYAADTNNENHTQTKDAGHHHATILVPDSLTDLWSYLNAYGKTVANAAASGEIDVLHKQQVNLEALVQALKKSPGEFDAAKQKRVDGMIGNAQRALSRLHEAIDAENIEQARKAAKALSSVLALLKAHYPKSITGGMAEVKDDIGPHEGVLAAFTNSRTGLTAGHLELKLHDDKGDLELWLAEDATMSRPFDLPAGSKITVNFEGPPQDSAILAARNADKNEDEDGHPNMRDGKTNYFIFPGGSGADSTWLMGKEFRSTVSVSFSAAGGEFASDPFLLIPHTHHDH